MSDSTLYDDDILLWSEQQAAAIRRLGATRRDLPNELDIENVAEEIESVGRSELAAVKSYLRLMFLHLMKLALDGASQDAPHWRSEVVGFHAEMIGRYAPSMRQRIDVDQIWRLAHEQFMLANESGQRDAIGALAVRCPLNLDDLITSRIDLAALVGRLTS
jgi:hypothetical protein